MSDKELEPQINDEVENEFVEAAGDQVEPAVEADVDPTEAPAQDAEDAQVIEGAAEEAEGEDNEAEEAEGEDN
ncbi:MAG: transcription termination/antitermination factor NusG, partial [Glutamicibacter sp.]